MRLLSSWLVDHGPITYSQCSPKKKIVLVKSNEELAHILMLCGEMADHSHPWTLSPMIPLQVAPIADQAFETAIFS